MTALAGLWRLDGRPDAAQGCERMLAAQRMYGPDDCAQWSRGDVALGRDLKRVLPEDTFDLQPITGASGRVLAADVRLDNRDELIRVLQIPPGQAAELSDAAILFSAIERWGEDCFDHIVGDYAFALWNAAQKSLLLARDPLGRRPLHYHRGKTLFAFASMPKGLHALPEIPYGPDEEMAAEWLALMPPHGSQTFFAGIERVEPGHVVTVTADRISARRHWNPPRRIVKLKGPGEYAQALRAHLDEAVRCRLRGTGDVGAYMSGGLDSSAVSATAARLLAPSDRRVIAYTAVPREGYNGAIHRGRFIDESAHAAAIAALYPNMEHVLIGDADRSPLAELENIFFFDQAPVLNLCNTGWGSAICGDMKARSLKIALSGDFGNAGLSLDGWDLMPELIGSGRWLRWLREARGLHANGHARWRRIFGESLRPWCPPAIWNWLNGAMNGFADTLTDFSAIHPQRLAELDLARLGEERGLDFTSRPPKDSYAARLSAMQSADTGNRYLGDLANWGIDTRDPTTDIRLLEFSLAVPLDQYMRDGVPRALARRALSDRLPKIVVDETRKGLQAADWHERMAKARDEIEAEIDRLDACPAAARALDLERLHRLVEQWPETGWEREGIVSSYRSALLRAISMGHFLRRASGSNA